MEINHDVRKAANGKVLIAPRCLHNGRAALHVALIRENPRAFRHKPRERPLLRGVNSPSGSRCIRQDEALFFRRQSRHTTPQVPVHLPTPTGPGPQRRLQDATGPRDSRDSQGDVIGDLRRNNGGRLLQREQLARPVQPPGRPRPHHRRHHQDGRGRRRPQSVRLDPQPERQRHHLLNNGSLTLTNAAISGTIEVGFNQSLHLVGTDTNTGTIKVDPGGNLDIQGTLNNAGTVDLVGGLSHGTNRPPNLSGSGVLNNTGTILKEGVLAASGANLTINDLGGKIAVTGGSLSLGKGTSLGGNYTVSTGATLELSNGGDRTISGTFKATGGGLVSITTLSHRLLVTDAGATFDFAPGMLEIVGGNIYAATAGHHPTLTNLSTITVPSNDSLRIDGVQVVEHGGSYNRLGNATIVLQDGASIK